MDRRTVLWGLPAIAVTAQAQPQSKAARLLAAAHAQTKTRVTYDPTYTRIPYPNGDVAPDKGVCTDVVIRAYRSLGIDLQRLVHEDMAKNFRLYPKAWGLKKPDPNIDHRRVPNLEVFFRRFAAVRPLSRKPEDYQPGDLVTCRIIGSHLPHIMIVSDQLAFMSRNRYQVIHNIGAGPKQEDQLFLHDLTGHYRFEL
ncbi:DUF1287 domain-containing protein [Asticcacaulis sp. YBE204]|uniref:DUF1287 domain-containing protein n=1 Tax=Asticcacaulis sp. YBE204 TaxID=1282363 RepID=UPI0003C3FFDC|nr:DUF1287 domain-containing protein [Asticcacaulis sp. YBE204]ESQ77967.1 hypothetical protein AEYBE204_15845 [Asticcacaulis sp. YBE204]